MKLIEVGHQLEDFCTQRRGSSSSSSSLELAGLLPLAAADLSHWTTWPFATPIAMQNFESYSSVGRLPCRSRPTRGSSCSCPR
eukprot:3857553-Prymnesium_polylepis.1